MFLHRSKFYAKSPRSQTETMSKQLSLRRCISLATRPLLDSILPKRKILARVLFDADSRLSHRKIVPILQSVYDGLDSPENIKLPRYATCDDLMICKNLLSTLRNTTGAIDHRLAAVEAELVEQAAELGNKDAIAALAFETVSAKTSQTSGARKVTDDDFAYANVLIKGLTEINHPLTFKLAGDLAFKNGYYEQLEQYWLRFIELEPDTITASNVYASLGLYYFSYKSPRPDLMKAKLNFEKCVSVGDTGSGVLQSHYYLGQLYSITDPRLAKYHWELCASKGFKESFSCLGFLELNVFCNLQKCLEWFKLGYEASGDISCLIGQFDCRLRMKDLKLAFVVLEKLQNIQAKIASFSSKAAVMPPGAKQSMEETSNLLETFFSTRKDVIRLLPLQLA